MRSTTPASHPDSHAMESYDIIANQPVVIDNGSGVIKAGFAGDQIPKYCFPNYNAVEADTLGSFKKLLDEILGSISY